MFRSIRSTPPMYRLYTLITLGCGIVMLFFSFWLYLFAVFWEFFPTNVDRTFTTLLSFHRMSAILDLVWTDTSDAPLSSLLTSSMLLSGGFSLRQVLTVPVVAMDFSQRWRNSPEDVKKLSITTR